jgi:hypothetical protein
MWPRVVPVVAGRGLRLCHASRVAARSGRGSPPDERAWSLRRRHTSPAPALAQAVIRQDRPRGPRQNHTELRGNTDRVIGQLVFCTTEGWYTLCKQEALRSGASMTRGLTGRRSLAVRRACDNYRCNDRPAGGWYGSAAGKNTLTCGAGQFP